MTLLHPLNCTSARAGGPMWYPEHTGPGKKRGTARKAGPPGPMGQDDDHSVSGGREPFRENRFQRVNYSPIWKREVGHPTRKIWILREPATLLGWGRGLRATGGIAHSHRALPSAGLLSPPAHSLHRVCEGGPGSDWHSKCRAGHIQQPGPCPALSSCGWRKVARSLRGRHQETSLYVDVPPQAGTCSSI